MLLAAAANAQTATGVVEGRVVDPAGAVLPGAAVRAKEASTGTVTFQTDGIANGDSAENQNRQDVNISTIREFQVLTNSFSAEFGRGSGTVVLVETKSGTNDYRGEGFWETTNSALNARTYFQNEAGSRVDPATR